MSIKCLKQTETVDFSLLFISYKFVKGFLAITFLLLVFSNWNFQDVLIRFIYQNSCDIYILGKYFWGVVSGIAKLRVIEKYEEKCSEKLVLEPHNDKVEQSGHFLLYKEPHMHSEHSLLQL